MFVPFSFYITSKTDESKKKKNTLAVAEECVRFCYVCFRWKMLDMNECLIKLNGPPTAQWIMYKGLIPPEATMLHLIFKEKRV